MKTKLYTLFFLTLMYAMHVEAAKPVNKAVSNWANWSSSGTWSLGRIPSNGDSVVIPSGYIIFLDTKPTLNNVDVMVAGDLVIDLNSGLVLDNSSEVALLSTGLLAPVFSSSTEVITIGGVTKYLGTDNFVTGPNIANKNTGTSPTGFSVNTLPVTWVSFTAIRTGEAVKLNWNTVNEKNNSHFEVERSLDGSGWTTIGTVAAGTWGQEDSYSYTDETAGAAQVEYRLSQVDLDGRSEYSKIVTVGANATSTTTTATVATIFAAGKTINIRFAEPSHSRVTVRLISMGGQVLQQETIEAASGTTSFSASNLPAGIYVVCLADGRGWSSAQKVML